MILRSLGGQVANIEWGKTQADTVMVLRRVTQQVCDDLYDNGQLGLISRVEEFMTKHSALDEERSKQHKANTDRLNIIIGLLIAIAAYIAIVVSVHGPFKTSLDPQKVFHSQTTVDVANQQNTQIHDNYHPEGN